MILSWYATFILTLRYKGVLNLTDMTFFFLWLSKARTLIFNIIYRGPFCVQRFEVSGCCSFFWHWTSLFKLIIRKKNELNSYNFESRSKTDKILGTKRERSDLKKKIWIHFQQYFSYIVTVSFIDGGNQSTWRKPQICRK